MRRPGAALVATVLALGLGAPADAAPDPRTDLEGARASVVARVDVDLPRPARGRAALRLLGDRVDAAAGLNGMDRAAFTDLLRSDPTVWLSTDARLFYVDPADPRAETGLVAGAAPPYPLDQTFALHSKPGAQRTIFIDVDGANVSGTEWHASQPTTPTSHPAWDPGGNGASFTDAEKAVVQDLWARVAEDYAPFDVDVTTQDPGAAAIVRSSPADPVYGSHALVSPSGAWASICDEECGGVAFLDVFDAVAGPGGNGYGRYQPAWVFPQGTGDSAKSVAEALSHEVGHQLGLDHDGKGSEDYDAGHGSWVPIMGAGYERPISQWSKGDYPGATNKQDDVAIIAGHLGTRTDEAPSVIAGAAAVPTGTAYIAGRADVDVYRLGTCTGPVTVTADPLLPAGANLDVQLRLLNSAGTTVQTADPASATVDAGQASGLGASITTTLASGAYYVAVDGVGNGSWTTGYDDYGSLGAYRVGVTGSCVGDGTPGVPGSLAVTAKTGSSVALSWAAPALPGASPVTGYVLTRTGSATEVALAAGATSHTWTGLAGGTAYTFSVAAVNAQGRGPAATVSAATTAVVPTAPQALVATWNPAADRADLSWTPPGSDGGSAITGYDILVDGTPVGTVPGTSGGVTGLAPGTTHVIAVAAVNAAGRGALAQTTFAVPEKAPAPANDAFASRRVISGTTGTVADDNTAATGEPADPVPPMIPGASGAGDASLWYSWTAPASGTATLSTASAMVDRDTTLAVYTGSTLAGLVLVAGNDDVSDSDLLSRVGFPATAGTTYAVAVDGYPSVPGGTGPFTLAWSLVAPAATSTALAAGVGAQSVTLTATVTAPTGTPSGVVTFREGAAELATVPLAAGTARITMTGVSAGSHGYTATFAPTGGTPYLGSTSGVATVIVTAATAPAPVLASTTTLTAPRKVKARARPKVTVTVGSAAGPATGQVVLRHGAKTVTLTLAGGRATFKLPRLKTGKLKLTASYTGNATTSASSVAVVIKVRRR